VAVGRSAHRDCAAVSHFLTALGILLLGIAVSTRAVLGPTKAAGPYPTAQVLGTFRLLSGSGEWKGTQMSVGTILLIILILILIGALPTWGYSGSWGYGPSGIIGVVVIVILVLLLMGRI
jgi:Protein of unknown function (DUF3309)